MKREQPGAVVVSACLLGRRCRFDGRDKLTPALGIVLEGRRLVPVCPEELGGLGTPRLPCVLSGGDGAAVLDGVASVLDSSGNDRRAAFVAGARAALDQALAAGVSDAILKDNSPSCGVRRVYRDGHLVKGEGVFSALLRRHRIAVHNETVARLPKRHRP